MKTPKPIPMDRLDLELALRDAFPTRARSADAAYFNEHWRRYADTLTLLPAPQPGARLLDVGVLPGHLGALARSRGYSVSGITNIPAPDDFYLVAARLGMDLRKTDLETELLPFPDDHFSVVLFCEVIEHLYRNPFRALGEIFRVLQPGGFLLLTTPSLSAVEKLMGLLRGFSFRPSLYGPLEIAFPPRLSHTHFREYTDRELAYLLRHQSKSLHLFHLDEILYSSCWQPALRDVVHAFARPGRLVGGFVAWAVARLLPRTRSCLMLRARKPRSAAGVPPAAWRQLTGFFEVERDADPPPGDRHSLPVPFRWTSSAAGFVFDNPKPGAFTHIRIRCGRLAPGSLPSSRVRWSLNGGRVLETSPAASQELSVVELPIPDSLRAVPTLRLELETIPWSPREFGFSDSRDLGLMLAWEPLLLVRPESGSSVLESLDSAIVQAAGMNSR